ncbi:MAG: hypothetical protein ACLU38_01265 [Dysosmobacter sp.]
MPGGPQGQSIILGQKPCIDRMKRHPLARAIRVDKNDHRRPVRPTLTTYQGPAPGRSLGDPHAGHAGCLRGRICGPLRPSCAPC